MKIRCRHALALLALAPIASRLPAQNGLVYAPGTRHYHLLSVVSRVQDVGGQKAEYKITNEQHVSMTLDARSKDTLTFVLTLDSSRVTSNPSIQLPDLTKLQGTTVSGAMSPAGKIYSYTSTAAPGDADARNLAEGMSKFLLQLPDGATRGSAWTDTSTSSVNRDGNDLSMRTITTSKVVGDTTYAGQTAWRVERTSVLSLEGSQSQGGQQLKVSGDGNESGMYFLSHSGVYLGSSMTQNMTMNILLPTGASVPVVQTVTSTVELLPGG